MAPCNHLEHNAGWCTFIYHHIHTETSGQSGLEEWDCPDEEYQPFITFITEWECFMYLKVPQTRAKTA